MYKNNILKAFFIMLLFSACSSYKPQYSISDKNNNTDNKIVSEKKEIEKSFYLIGDAGNADIGRTTDGLAAFSKYIESSDTKNDYALFLGDNIYENGLPKKEDKDRKLAEHRINVQIDAVKDFNGKVLFIPGNHDWRNNGLKGLSRQEKYIEKALNDKDAFQPKNGCPIKKINVSESIALVVIDAQWYTMDWDKHPTINDECDIKTKNDFFIEFENILGKSNEKTVVIAMHHPTYTNGTHGGKFNFEKHIFPFQNRIPLPVFGSLAAQLRTTGGVSPQDNSNEKYRELMKRITTLARGNDQVIFVSGHDHNLQYIENSGIKQIISGSGSKESAATLGTDGLFSYGRQGFAVLDVFTDGSSEVSYFSAENGAPKLLFQSIIYNESEPYDASKLAASFPLEIKTTIYKKEDTEKSKNYNWFWGDHFRKIYGTDISVPVATLDTLYGGLTLIRSGGGHQSRSIRVINKEGKVYVLRAVKKSAVQFLQTVAFKKVYVEEDLKETFTEELVLDFYTSGHPFGSFAIPDLSDAIGLYHANPHLIYIPKHAYLGDFNEAYGDELYIIEEHPDDTFLDEESFGKPDAIESTFDVLENIRKDEKYQIDEPAYIKARIFDMLVGDWDRHYDQWRWSRFDVSKDKVLYKPIPRDRDQAFSNFDGAGFDVMKFIIPDFRQFQVYSENIKNVKWINLAGIKTDRSFIQNSSRDIWIEQAKFIQEHITDEIIDEAFSKLPLELHDETSNAIKEKLRLRRANIVDIASRYYDYLSKLVIITATDKDDFIKITRGDEMTSISISRIKKGEIKKPYKERIIYSAETDEIWVYGLDDADQIEVVGEGEKPVFTRIVGGQDNDIYTIKNGRGIKVHDHKSKPNTVLEKNTAAIKFQDIYSNNIYDYTRHISKMNSIIPFLGYNPDDGIQLKLKNTYTIKGFKNDPFYRRYTLDVGYFFATQGWDLKLEGVFTQTFGNWNFIAGFNFANDNYTQSFFGFGNETPNLGDDLGHDYNRVRTGLLGGKIGITKYGHYGSLISITAALEKVEVEPTEGRFITDYFSGNPEYFDENFTYANIDFTYTYSNYDLLVNPAKGFNIIYKTGVRSNLDDFDKTYAYIHPKIEFYNSLTRDKRLVLKTMIQGQFNLGHHYEFFHSAKLGAHTGLRGYRTQRFSGQSAFALGGDIRYSFRRIKTNLFPVQLGIFGGYDLGRVWVKDESSSVWHDDVGGGFWINILDTASGQFGIFTSDESLRFTFGLGISM